MIRLTDHVYVETKYPGANLGCIVTGRGLILVDTPMLPGEADDWKCQLRGISGMDVAYVIYTHQHFDHVMGGAFFNAPVIAHAAAESGLTYLETNLGKEIALFSPQLYRERQEMFDSYRIRRPEVTFSKDLQLHMGDLDLQLIFVAGHSSASIIVEIPRDRVAFAGDNVVTGMPPITANGRFGPWIDMLQSLEKMDIDQIVPGHGETCGKEGAARIRSYFVAMRDQLKTFISSGMSREDAVNKVNVNDFLPVPGGTDTAMHVLFDSSLMYDQIRKGLA